MFSATRQQRGVTTTTALLWLYSVLFLRNKRELVRSVCMLVIEKYGELATQGKPGDTQPTGLANANMQHENVGCEHMHYSH